MKSDLHGKNDFNVADSAGDSDRHFALMTIKDEIKTRGSDREVSNFDPFKERRKHRTVKTYEALRRIDL